MCVYTVTVVCVYQVLNLVHTLYLGTAVYHTYLNLVCARAGRATLSRATKFSKWTRHFLQYARRAHARISSSWHATKFSMLIMFSTAARTHEPACMLAATITVLL